MPDSAPFPLLERERELTHLDRWLSDAARATGRVALVAADAGYGKTRLLDETGSRAELGGMAVLRGRAVPGCGPYRPVAEALLGRVRDLAVATPELMPFRRVLGRLLPGWSGEPIDTTSAVDPSVVMGEAVLRLLRAIAGDRGCFVGLDDLHWADPDTLALLEYLAGALDGTSALVLGAARSDERAPALLRRLRQHPRVPVLELAPLTDAAVRDLAASRLGGRMPPAVEEQLVSNAEGSPLLAEELADGVLRTRAPDGPPDGWPVGTATGSVVPRTLADLVADRLAVLTPTQRDVVTTVAVVGPGLPPRVIAQAAELSETAVLSGLRAAVEQHLLTMDTSDGEDLRWRHALTRDAVLGTLLPPEREDAARRGARAIEDAGASGTDALALAAALHSAGGRPLDAARLHLELARRAARTGALGSALDRLAAATQAAAGDPLLSVAVAAETVGVLASTGRVEEALRHGRRALQETPGEAATDLALALARAAITADRFGEAAQVLTAHVPAGDARGIALAARAAFGTGDPAGAAALASEAARASEAAVLPDVLCDAWEILGRVARQHDLTAAEVAFTRAHDVALAAGLVPARIRALSELGILDGLRRADPARLVEARSLASGSGMLGVVAQLDLQSAACLSVRDGPSAAHRPAAAAADMAERLRLDAVAASALLFVAGGLLAQGRRSDMRRAVQRALDLDDGGSVDVRVWALGLQGLAALLDGDPGTALRHLEDGVLTLRQGTVASAAAWWGIWVVLRTAADGTVPLPGPEFELAQVHAANVVALGYARAIAAAAVGDTEASVREMASADVLADPMPHWANLMRLLASQAALQGGWGDPVGWLRGCLAHFETREPLFATLARELLRRAGAPVPRRRQGAGTVPEWLRAAGITGREMEVLHLLGENLTNAEIGRRLFLSPRTVETHVKHLMEKLGTNRRSELAAAAGRRRPGPPFRSPPGGVRAPAS